MTDSYHAAVFSILGKKPFVCYTREGSSIRARNLLEDLELSDRFLPGDRSDVNLLLTEIDFDAVYEKREKMESPVRGISEKCTSRILRYVNRLRTLWDNPTQGKQIMIYIPDILKQHEQARQQSWIDPQMRIDQFFSMQC